MLFNLGGPDRPEAVQPFLFNLFNDPAIIGIPQPFRWLLANLISRRRAPVAREIYDHIGGRSPLLELTEAQAEALERRLNDTADAGSHFRVLIAMRYWHPMSDETAITAAEFEPDQVVLLPLYPQFSTTTTGSSVKDWDRAARAAGLSVPTRTICCYPTVPAFVTAHADAVRDALAPHAGARPRLLFSAHGLPMKVIDAGDPDRKSVV